ncbi:hypothetical protein [Streptomyces sp. UG1]|uniref:hypothetical protein n=1 Tax=Streptomyces sp. UG1 TaxID=3417652 RepID=UPI003CE8E934
MVAAPGEDREAHRSGVELAFWTNRQVRHSGLCTSCWFRESDPDIRFCDGGGCRNFTRPLHTLERAHEAVPGGSAALQVLGLVAEVAQPL